MREQYKIIGTSLVSCDGNPNRFRVAVSFIPVEILESYLEDLLSTATPRFPLFLKKKNYSHISYIPLIATSLACILVASLIKLPYLGALLVLVFATTLFGAGIALYSYYHGALFRMRLAKTLHEEIKRRRNRFDETTFTFINEGPRVARASGMVH
jgi:hypothetical protein